MSLSTRRCSGPKSGKGVNVFDPTTGEVRSDNAGGMACWFIDTCNEESESYRESERAN